MILQKRVQDKKGLAEVAIEWFWTRHASYMSTAQFLLKDVVVPIQILNRKIDHVIGLGQTKRTERLQASLEAKLALLASVTEAGLGMSKRLSESSHVLVIVINALHHRKIMREIQFIKLLESMLQAWVELIRNLFQMQKGK